ncbi:MAG: glycoside hydrolase family 32 protein [Verrucomicrobiales bacterium]|nr:glycoside hydrolase family 32 protein [Verrucomicrobiales bacterium]
MGAAILLSGLPMAAPAAEGLSDGREAIARAMQSVSNAVPKATADPSRPMFHFRPPANWMNDPNGLIHHRGWYHLFYQHNPYGDGWGHMHWGHARSRDLVRWEHLPIALWPSEERGEEHVFSGSATLNASDEPVIFYTSIAKGKGADVQAEQWMALGSEDLLSWRKHPANPILSEALHGDRKVYDWRDPFIVRAGRRVFMVCGGNLNHGKGGQAVVRLYEAQNGELTQWKDRGVLFEHPDPEVKNIECPQLFQLDGTWVLMISPHRRVEWFTGTFDPEAGRFTAKRRGMADYGEAYYAPQCFSDQTGRRLLFGWIRGFPEGRGWNGCLTLPRLLSVSGGVLTQQPAPEVEQLRGARHRLRGEALKGERRWAEARGEALEIEAIFERGEASAVGLRLRQSSDGKRAVEVRWDGKRLDVGGASMSLFGDLTGGRVEMRLVLDRSVLEVYAAGQCLTRVIPFEAGDDGVSVFAEGDGARITSLSAWEMNPVW